MNIPRESWEHFGSAGHFCASSMCLFHLTTKVGQFLVSTVGEYFPSDKMSRVGAKLYETMVFEVAGECPCGCGLPDHSGSEIASGAWDSAKEAGAGHWAMCEKAATGAFVRTNEAIP